MPLITSNSPPRSPGTLGRVFPSARFLTTKRSGWTLVEVLVVLAIIALLFALTTASILKARESANRVACLSNLKDLVLVVHQYHNERRCLPPYASGKAGEIYGGWFVHLLPYSGYKNLYDLIAPTSSGSPGFQLVSPGVWTSEAQNQVFAELLCPSDASGSVTANRTNYLANFFALSPDDAKGPYQPAQRFVDLKDGLGNVVLFAEAYRDCDTLPRLALVSAQYHNFGITPHGKPSDDPYYAPEDYTMFQIQPAACHKWRTQTPHVAMNVALADGSVRVITPSISPSTWKEFLKPRDGLPAGNDW